MPPAWVVSLLVAALPAAARAWTFTEVAAAAGLDYEHGYLVPLTDQFGSYDERRAVGGGVAAGDYDGDGWIDLFVAHGDVGPDLLFRNRGDGTFEEAGAAAGVGLVGRFSAGPTFADVDGDGRPDLFVGGVKGTPLAFFRNRGDGTFEDRTAAVGLAFTRETQSAAFGDYDGDGDLDLALAHWGQVLTPGESTQTLWRNDGAAGFVDTSESSGIAPALRALFFAPGEFGTDYTFTPNFADLDDDGFPELLLASDFGTSRVFHNEGDGTFADATDPAVITDENGMGAALGDVDNDGRLDWFVSSIWDPDGVAEGRWGVTGNRLYRGLGGGAFEDVTEAAGVREGYWGWGATLGDFDDDGDLDLFHVNGWGSSGAGDTGAFYRDASRLFVASPAGAFTERSIELGIVDTGNGRGVVSFDYDRDGDLDLLVANNGGPLRLFRNDGGNAQGWLEVRLVGRAPNTEAIGAQLRLTTPSGRQLRVVRAGSNFVSQDPVVVHAGLGPHPHADLEIRWPSGERTFVPHVGSGTRMRLREPGDVASCEGAGEGACVPARGSAKRACLVEWRVAPPPVRPQAITSGRIACQDGDPACDLDAVAGNASCSFAVALCLENADPRFPRCGRQPVTRLDALAPAAGSPGRAVLDAALEAVPSAGPGGARCGPPHVLAVPSAVRRDGRPRPGKMRLVVRAEVGTRHVAARLVLRCAPAAGLN
jgi:hypothetical protein